MCFTGSSSADGRMIVGSRSNFWLWSQNTGWDLTHPPTPDEEPLLEHRLRLKCELTTVDIDPVKTALIVVDLQNYSMCKELRPDTAVPALFRAQHALLTHAIPAAREASIQIIWLNWGITQEDLDTMPPAAMRVFGWRANSDGINLDIQNLPRHLSRKDMNDSTILTEIPRAVGLGADLGEVILHNGTKVDAGRVLFKNSWNAAIHGELSTAYEEGCSAQRPDVLIHKNRNSGLWHDSTELGLYLKANGLRTLLFTGANIDQCVMGTLQDAHSQGYDTILLKDGCATDSPDYAQQSAEFNCQRCWGFLSTCSALAEATHVNSIQRIRR